MSLLLPLCALALTLWLVYFAWKEAKKLEDE